MKNKRETVVKLSHDVHGRGDTDELFPSESFDNLRFVFLWFHDLDNMPTIAEYNTPYLIELNDLNNFAGVCQHVLRNRNLAKTLLPNLPARNVHKQTSVTYDGIYFLQVQDVMTTCRNLVIEACDEPLYVTLVN